MNFFIILCNSNINLMCMYTHLLDCTEVPDCAFIGREECSLMTPQQTCGPCLDGYVGEMGTSNSECICMLKTLSEKWS